MTIFKGTQFSCVGDIFAFVDVVPEMSHLLF